MLSSPVPPAVTRLLVALEYVVLDPNVLMMTGAESDGWRDRKRDQWRWRRGGFIFKATSPRACRNAKPAKSKLDGAPDGPFAG